jgi:hypothetical protein
MPEGIDPEPPARRARIGRLATPITFLLLGGFLGAGLLGLFGGTPTPTRTHDLGDASLSLRVPEVLRNGEFFEMELAFESQAPLADAVIAIEPSLWRNITINTMIPAAAEEEFSDNAYRLHHGPLEPGERLHLKFDGQINPPMFLGTEGTVALFDGEQEIGAVPVSIKVLP